ncbi:hypothetical protein E2C01_079356 [Portunus trituberculatus]|uniref:Uncharacterized protein n=1 Tax=Portunus trituberculatus TaxID=210409 RepID=A0A5B7ILB3_PORTR|nr:hypothetical protein [Portunus trituberculatus]
MSTQRQQQEAIPPLAPLHLTPSCPGLPRLTYHAAASCCQGLVRETGGGSTKTILRKHDDSDI